MKQKLFIKIIALALCTAFVPVQAADVRQSATENAFIVSGDSYNSYENIPVIILNQNVDINEVSTLIESGADVSGKILFTGTAVADGKGNLTYSVPVGSETAKAVYNVYVAGEKTEVGFEKNETRVNLVDTIVNAGDTLATALEQNYMYLSVDNKMYDSCSGASAVAVVLAKELEKTPISSATENALSKLSEMIDKSILTVAANETKLTSLAQVEEKLSECDNTKTVIGLMEQITESGKTAILSGFQGNGFATVEDADKRFGQEIVLKAICYPTVKTSTALLSVLDEYNLVLGLDLSKFKKLSKTNKAQAIVEFSGKNPTVATMQDVLDDIVKGYKEPSSSGGGGGGGAGGGGGSLVVPTLPINPSNPGQSGTTGSVFNDLADVSWAKDAILTLHARGIIAGYGNNQFAPKNNITREEFVRLVVSAYYPYEKAESVAFDDVNKGAWYYDSVAVAVNKGIVSGVSEKRFGQGMNITRQDMAVILYRVAGGQFTVRNADNKFADDGMISDYAKEAVYALRDAGIINGVSDTEFAPKKNATRAETAVMLYRFMNSYGGI